MELSSATSTKHQTRQPGTKPEIKPTATGDSGEPGDYRTSAGRWTFATNRTDFKLHSLAQWS